MSHHSRILVVPDKFKGTLTAKAAAQAIARGWLEVRPHDTVRCVPMSDGGDGFGPVLGELLDAAPVTTRTVDAAGRPVTARWWWSDRTRTAIIETARSNGLAMLPRGRFHPFELDTRGVARLLEAATTRGARTILAGIGGSATNDGGFGLALALGWRFENRAGQPITRWTDLHSLRRIHPPPQRPRPPHLRVAVDVQNPLLGPRGASRIYGPQKGLQPADIALAEKNLHQLARTYDRQFGSALHRRPGTGAAGGLGYGLAAFAGAQLEPGFDLFARLARLETAMRHADWIVTAEGSVDKSSLMGKGVGEVAALAHRLGKPCIALGGVCADRPKLRRCFHWVHAIAPTLTSPDHARTRPAFWLRRLAHQAARQLDAT